MVLQPRVKTFIKSLALENSETSSCSLLRFYSSLPITVGFHLMHFLVCHHTAAAESRGRATGRASSCMHTRAQTHIHMLTRTRTRAHTHRHKHKHIYICVCKYVCKVRCIYKIVMALLHRERKKYLFSPFFLLCTIMALLNSSPIHIYLHNSNGSVAKGL